jgi:hypothetical protein
MKKLAFLFSAFVLLGAFAVSCSSDKKKKLTSNTAVIITDPADLSDGISYSSSVVITGKISSDSNAVISQWTISDPVLGTINGSTAAYNTNAVTWATPASGDAAGYIRAHWNGLTKDVKIAIGTCAVPGGGIPPTTSTSTLYVYSDSGLSTDLQGPMYYGDWQFYGGGYVDSRKPVPPQTSVLGTTEDPQSPGLYWLPTFDEPGGADTDNIKCFRADFKAGTNYVSNYYGGVAFIFNQTKDLSNYTNFVFWAKASVSANILIELKLGEVLKQQKIEAIGTAGWVAHTIAIDHPTADSIDRIAITIKKENGVNSPPEFALYLDNIYFE